MASEAKNQVKNEKKKKKKNQTTKGEGLKIWTPKQIIQRLPIALTQVNNWNQTTCLFIVSIKRNYRKSIQ